MLASCWDSWAFYLASMILFQPGLTEWAGYALQRAQVVTGNVAMVSAIALAVILRDKPLAWWEHVIALAILGRLAVDTLWALTTKSPGSSADVASSPEGLLPGEMYLRPQMIKVERERLHQLCLPALRQVAHLTRRPVVLKQPFGGGSAYMLRNPWTLRSWNGWQVVIVSEENSASCGRSAGAYAERRRNWPAGNKSVTRFCYNHQQRTVRVVTGLIARRLYRRGRYRIKWA